ncbi:MAG: tryptophan 7-halogenase, partial [Sphingomonas bacterium]|nr:tryptophan 7-halogenase [Sphingomonas bacterium]
ASVPPRLADLLSVWRHQPPSTADLPAIDEIFPAASYQYVLYGMAFAPPAARAVRGGAPVALAAVDQRARSLAASLPTNRSYLDALRAASLPAAMELIS